LSTPILSREPLVECLYRLEVLQMKGNLFSTVPPSLRAIPKLQVLNLADNRPLQLSAQGVGVLCHLPCLRTFAMGKGFLQGDPVSLLWTGESMKALLALKSRKPDLDIKID